MIGWGFFAMLLAVSVIFLCFVLFITWSILKSCKYSRNVKSSVGSKDRLACVNKILFLQTGQQGILLTDAKHLLFWLVEFSWRQLGVFHLSLVWASALARTSSHVLPRYLGNLLQAPNMLYLYSFNIQKGKL